MVIKKYLHSCILIEEEGKRLLIDPGSYSFAERKITPKDIGGVDIILFTHKHPDHYYPEALKDFYSLQSPKIVANEEIGNLLKKDGLSCELISNGETKTVEGFTIQVFNAPHGPLPLELPENFAFLINQTFLHPGDSFEPEKLPSCKILALPVTAMWGRMVDALEFANKVKPQQVIPIHDAFVKEWVLARVYEIYKEKLEENNISFRPLELGEELKL